MLFLVFLFLLVVVCLLFVICWLAAWLLVCCLLMVMFINVPDYIIQPKEMENGYVSSSCFLFRCLSGYSVAILYIHGVSFSRF